jgi:hypothetical protein
LYLKLFTKIFSFKIKKRQFKILNQIISKKKERILIKFFSPKKKKKTLINRKTYNLKKSKFFLSSLKKKFLNKPYPIFKKLIKIIF